ncbi:jg7599, partial [Pararge aegeria aegeria]
SETWSLTTGLIRRLRITQRAIERDEIKSEKLSIRRRIRVADIAQRVATLKTMYGAHSSEKGWTMGSQGAGKAAPYC